MNKRQYPRQAWVLQPSFKPKEVTLIRQCGNYGDSEDWDVAEGGKHYHKDSVFLTIEAAVADGREQIEKMRADIAKRQATLDKCIAALDKAESATGADSPKGDA